MRCGEIHSHTNFFGPIQNSGCATVVLGYSPPENPLSQVAWPGICSLEYSKRLFFCADGSSDLILVVRIVQASLTQEASERRLQPPSRVALAAKDGAWAEQGVPLFANYPESNHQTYR